MNGTGLICTFIAPFFLKKMGRKTNMVVGHLALALMLVLTTEFYMIKQYTLMFVCLSCFVGCFMCFIGSVSFLYPAEVCTDSGQGFVLGVLFLTMITMGVISPSLMSSQLQIEGMFFLFAGINVVCGIFCAIFMKET